MTFRDALKELRRRGTNHAEGDALRAMYAQLICFSYWGRALEPKFYEHLQKFDGQAMIDEARELMRDHSRTADVVLGLPVSRVNT